MGKGIVVYGLSNKNVSTGTVGVKNGVFMGGKTTVFIPTESEPFIIQNINNFYFM
jgi:hypothetical protein